MISNYGSERNLYQDTSMIEEEKVYPDGTPATPKWKTFYQNNELYDIKSSDSDDGDKWIPFGAVPPNGINTPFHALDNEPTNDEKSDDSNGLTWADFRFSQVDYSEQRTPPSRRDSDEVSLQENSKLWKRNPGKYTADNILKRQDLD